MRTSTYTDEQIAFALKQANAGTPVPSCRDPMAAVVATLQVYAIGTRPERTFLAKGLTEDQPA
ncbi:hypothetical protein U1872_04170 [Sphingomonas sp. RB3P16]|uniref:hypothetical protein n=1 Tax=Parasphingomonas frigoris TaxID=3096163 RepID=UPI002FC59917